MEQSAETGFRGGFEQAEGDFRLGRKAAAAHQSKPAPAHIPHLRTGLRHEAKPGQLDLNTFQGQSNYVG